jgi:putative glutamine amidotransferase
LPSIYGEAAHPTYSAAEPGRDDYELELTRRALDADLPLLAICRGIQVLNVARGGSLVQDIPAEVGATVNHVHRESPVTIAHEVWIAEGSLLDRLMHELLEGDACNVNSRHHQAPKTLGAGLSVSATAPDGVIEAIEDPSRRFCLGVQWHPENFYRTGEFRSIFEGLVEAARK